MHKDSWLSSEHFFSSHLTTPAGPAKDLDAKSCGFIRCLLGIQSRKPLRSSKKSTGGWVIPSHTLPCPYCMWDYLRLPQHFWFMLSYEKST